MLSDWVIKRLSGEIASDPSNAGTTGIFSLKTRQWSPDMTRTLGLRDDFFPQVYESGHVIGQVTASAAKDTGLAPHTPVVMGGGDAQLGSVGLGVVKEGQAAILGGTFWQQEVNMATPKTDPEMNIRVNPHVVEGLSQAEAIVFFAGLTLRWFRDAFCQEEIKRAEAEGVDAYTILESMAREVPAGSRGIIPVFSDEMRYHQWYHAAPSLLNLTLDASRCGKAEIFRALQENAAIVAAANLERIFSFTQVENGFLVFAGGASKGEVWCQILADVTEKPVRVPVVKEATALGTAIAAGKGVGIFENFQRAADELVSWEKEYTPDPANVELYRDVKNRWREAYKPQRELVDRGVTEALWKAPGL
jgi:autoinducer 2 (AI-2) kinase